MSPSTRSRTWLIAAIAALNAAWLAYAWLTWVPKDVIEVVAAPAAELEPRTPLRWTFNLDMVADQQLQQPPAVTPTMEPALAGSWTWHDRRTLEFTAARPLPEATTITVHLAKDALRSRDGFRLHGDLAQVMRTAPLAVLGAHVASFDADGHATVVMDFNQAVDPTLIAKRLAVAPVTAPDAAQPGPTRPDAAQPDPAQPAPGAGHPSAPAVVAADPTPGASVRLVVPAGAGPAQLRLPAGTTGTAGPLGLAAAWSTTLELGHVLAVTGASAEAPAHGDVVVHLATAPAGAPLELLADALSVTPAVPFRIVAGDGGLDLVGAFAPRTEYRVEVAARWPEADAPRHPLAAYPAAASLAVPIPVRRAGMWFPQDGFHDGRLAVASTAIGAATAEVFAAGDASPVRLPVASQELAWTPSGDDGTRTALIDGDTLLAGLPAGRYRLRLRSEDAEAAAAIETTVTVQDAAVRPLALLDGLASWLRAGMDGRGEADLRVRTVALAGE